jgi:hypothetical protein
VGVNVILPLKKVKEIILTYNSEVDQGVSSWSRFEVHSTPVDPLFMFLHKQVSGFFAKLKRTKFAVHKKEK